MDTIIVISLAFLVAGFMDFALWKEMQSTNQ